MSTALRPSSEMNVSMISSREGGKDATTIVKALGYDMNSIEFAVRGGVPYAIDFMNPAPDAELASVGEFYHNWIVNTVIDLVFKRLAETREQPRYRWDALLNPEPITPKKPAAKRKSSSR